VGGAAGGAVAGVRPQTAARGGPAPARDAPRTPGGAPSAPPPQPHAEPLTEALRGKGFHECNPHDPIGLGPYSEYRKLRMGRIAIPQRGGHTADYGYDVLMHFHGHEPLRKTLVQVARGVTYVGVDRGVGSGPYTEAFSDPKRFPRLLASITRNLRDHSGQPKAHIRHLALSAWSAGYGAVNRILKHKPKGVDAVVLLDGLHAAWKPGAAHHSRPSDVDPLFIRPIFDFAVQAQRGHGIFYLTHSQVEPEGGYPSVKLTTATLLFAGEGPGGAPVLRAHDKATGDIIADIALPAPQTGLPMSYSIDGEQYIVVAVAGPEHPAELVALKLP